MGSSSPSKLYDPVRRKWVPALPEEAVRQRLLRIMLDEKGFPKHLLAVEVELARLPHLIERSSLPDRRADILCFSRGIHPHYPFYPLLLVECKGHDASSAAFEQAWGYNRHVQAPFVAVAGPTSVCCAYREKGEWRTFDALPSYPQLLQAVLK
jgi:hypothetical protein